MIHFTYLQYNKPLALDTLIKKYDFFKTLYLKEKIWWSLYSFFHLLKFFSLYNLSVFRIKNKIKEIKNI